MNEVYLKWDPAQKRDASLGLRYGEDLVLSAVEAAPARPLAEGFIGKEITHVDSMQVTTKAQADKLLWTAVDRVSVRFYVPPPLRISPPPPGGSSAASFTSFASGRPASVRMPTINKTVKAPPPKPQGFEKAPPKAPTPSPSPSPYVAGEVSTSSTPSPVMLSGVREVKELVDEPTQTEQVHEVAVAATQTVDVKVGVQVDAVPRPSARDERKLAARRAKNERTARTIRHEQAAIKKMQKIVESLGTATLQHEGASNRTCPHNHPTNATTYPRQCSLCKQLSTGLHCPTCYYTMCWGCAPTVRRQPLPNSTRPPQSKGPTKAPPPVQKQTVTHTATPGYPTPVRESHTSLGSYEPPREYNESPQGYATRGPGGPSHYRFPG